MMKYNGLLLDRARHLRVKSQSGTTAGSSLIWVMVVVLVMVIVLGMGLVAVSGRFHQSAVHHQKNQAYYTALSSTETIVAWITEDDGTQVNRATTEEAGAIAALLERIETAGTGGVTIEEDGLPAEAGTCTVNLCWLDEGKTQLKITSTATFAGATETVSQTLKRPEIAANAFEGELKASDFSTTEYDTQAGELTALPINGGIVNLGDLDRTHDTTHNSNSNDVATLNNSITENSDKEARWFLNGVYDSEVLSTQTYGLNGSGGTTTDSRRFVVPKNGRILINPLEKGTHITDNGHGSMTSPTATYTNTKLTSLAIDTSNAEKENILLRLARVGDTEERYNALLMLTFTDYKGTTETTEGYTWHPNDWESLDVYLRPDAGLNTNVLIGPFGHTYDCFMDTYWSWGNYRDDHHGATIGEFGNQWPYVSSKTHFANYGLPMFSADYGNAGFWILDGTTNILYPGTNGTGGQAPKYFRIMQGVNIFNGVIYSTRPAIIGGGLIKKSIIGQTTDDVNSGTDGFNEQTDNDYAAVYTEGTLRYSQIISNTDIVLKAPLQGTGTVSSTIRRPDTWRDRVYRPGVIPAKDKTFDPTMTIKGGTIYVGERQHLTIQGTVTGAKSGTEPEIVSLDNMWISPDKIVVAEGGKLTIESSKTTNVITDIYVEGEGSTLIINAYAKIKGNIYAYNGGTVDVRGGFELKAPSSTEYTPQSSGIFIYGADAVEAAARAAAEAGNEAVAVITGIGHIIVSGSFPSITDGSSSVSGKVHLAGGEWADLGSGAALSPSNGALFFCADYDEETGRCKHSDDGPVGVNAGWIAGPYDNS